MGNYNGFTKRLTINIECETISSSLSNIADEMLIVPNTQLEVYIHVCMCVRVRVCACVYACTYMCMYVYVYICITYTYVT